MTAIAYDFSGTSGGERTSVSKASTNAKSEPFPESLPRKMDEPDE